MQSKQSTQKQLLMLGLGAALILFGPKLVELWQSYQATQAELDARTDEATEKLKDFFLDEKEPYHPDRPVSQEIDDATLDAADRISRLRQQVENHIPNPTKMIDPQPTKKEIIIFSADWCEPCQRWKRCEQEKFRALGYSFATGIGDVSPLPHFIVTDGSKTVEVSGYMTPQRLESELRK